MLTTAKPELVAPGPPTSVVLGVHYTKDTLSMQWRPPHFDGGSTVTAYRIELDSSTAFVATSDDYRAVEVSFTAELQTITTHFRSGEDSRGGTFVLRWGGQTSAPLIHDASADDVARAISQLTGVWDVGVPPVKVSRARAPRGYIWRVRFLGIYGNVGLIEADGTMLKGDDARIDVAEYNPGSCDIVPGGFTYEVQTIYVDALSPVSGKFALAFEGAKTRPIVYDASADEMKRALEGLGTIFTVNVRREIRTPASFGMYAWTVTFTHQAHTLTQGAQDATLIVADASSLEPSSTARVNIFENIRGTDAFSFQFDALTPGQRYFARVGAYTQAGYGPVSSVSDAIPKGQPTPPLKVAASVLSGSSLRVNWIPPLNDAGAHILGYVVERYEFQGSIEVQVVTTSAGDGLPEIQSVSTSANNNGLTGFFTLSFGGETTELIAVDAPAEGEGSVRAALERLGSSGEVEVNRDYSMDIIRGVYVSIGTGDAVATVSSGSFAWSELTKNDIVRVAGETFRVRYVESYRLALGSLDNHLQAKFFVGANVTHVRMYKWAYGYQWSVTFSSLVGPQQLLVAQEADFWAGTSPILRVERQRAGSNPLKGTFRLGFEGDSTPPIAHNASALDIESALEGLTTIADVTVERTINNNGYNYLVRFLSPNSDVPLLYAFDDMLTGPSAAARVSTFADGSMPSGYGSEHIAGLYSTTVDLTGLSAGVSYQIRVAAYNSEGFSAPAYLDNGLDDDEGPGVATPVDAPDPPTDLELYALSPIMLRVEWSPPLYTGGQTLVGYVVEWDTDANFANIDTSGYRATPHATLNATRECYDIAITAASSSLPRFVRVAAFNGFAYSYKVPSVPDSAAGALRPPGPPVSVRLEVTSGVGLFVDWDPPSENTGTCGYGGDGGGDISHYVVEWDVNAYFDSPAERVIISSSNASFLIGGRDPLTGVESTVLERGTR